MTLNQRYKVSWSYFVPSPMDHPMTKTKRVLYWKILLEDSQHGQIKLTIHFQNIEWIFDWIYRIILLVYAVCMICCEYKGFILYSMTVLQLALFTKIMKQHFSQKGLIANTDITLGTIFTDFKSFTLYLLKCQSNR